MNKIKITVIFDSQHMISYEADKNIYKATFDTLQSAVDKCFHAAGGMTGRSDDTSEITKIIMSKTD